MRPCAAGIAGAAPKRGSLGIAGGAAFFGIGLGRIGGVPVGIGLGRRGGDADGAAFACIGIGLGRIGGAWVGIGLGRIGGAAVVLCCMCGRTVAARGVEPGRADGGGGAAFGATFARDGVIGVAPDGRPYVWPP